jgi:thymidylate synthase
MIYNRPSMQEDYKKNGMHDFMCCQNVQYFINERDDQKFVDCIVNFRSNDAVFGYCNDYLWEAFVLERLAEKLVDLTRENIKAGQIWWNAGSLHIYERHFKFLEEADNELI